MRSQFILAAAFAVSLASTTALAQLGPKDGVGLIATELDRIKIGQPAPDFSLEDVNGNTMTLSDFRGKKNVVLVFYRGYW